MRYTNSTPKYSSPNFFSLTVILLITFALIINPIAATAADNAQLSEAGNSSPRKHKNTNVESVPETKTSSKVSAPLTVFTNSANIAIPDDGVTGVTSTIAVSGTSGPISALTLTLNNVNTPRPQHLDMLLVGPGGQKFIFLSDAGGQNSGSNTVNATMTFIDGGATIAQAANTPFTTGSFRPIDYDVSPNFPTIAPPYSSAAPIGSSTFSSIFGGLSGASVNGNWVLHIWDGSAGPGASSISGGWSLNITTTPAAQATTTTIASSLNPSNTNQAVTFTATVTSGSAVNTGVVNFVDNTTGATLCSAVAVNASGVATCLVAANALTERIHNVQATYVGNATFATSNGSINQTVNTPTTAAGSQFTNPGAIVVTDAGGSTAAVPYPSNISVSGLTGSISKVTVSLLNVNLPNTGDIDLLLVGPGGQKYVFMSDAGGANSLSTGTITLDDAAATQLPASGAIAAGTYKPTDYAVEGEIFPAPAPAPPYNSAPPAGTATFASIFGGASPNGTWSLYATDDSGSGAVSQTINGWRLTFTTTADAATTTVLTSSPNPSTTSQTVLFTANVSSGGNPVTVGTVTFRRGATVLCANVALNGSGAATCNVAAGGFPQGDFVITADYNGSAGAFNISNGSTTQQVDSPTVVTGGNNFANNGGITIPNSSIGTPYPSRIFVNGLGGTISKVTLTMNGINAPTPDDLDFLLVGPLGQKFLFMGDAGGNTAISGVNITLDDAAATALPDSTVIASGTYKPASYAGFDAFPAPAPSAPYNPAATEGTGTFANIFNNSNPNGTWNLFAVEDAGDANNTTITGWSLTFTLTPSATTTTVTSSANPSVFGQPVTFTATVTSAGGTPTGNVTFFDGATNLGTAPLNGAGAATFTTSTLTVGPHTITAQYAGAIGAGGGGFSASNGTLTGGQTVNKADTSVALTSTQNPVVFGTTVTFTATISVTAPGAGSPTGTVQFLDGATPIAGCTSVSVAGGAAQCSTNALSVGSHTINAQYSGNTNFNASSGSGMIQVNALATIYLNEVLFNPPGTDAPNEYLEFRGTPNSTIPAGVYFVGIEGDTTAPGDVQTILNLSGLTFGSNGYLVILQNGNTYTTNAGATVITSTSAGFGGLPGNIFSADGGATDIEDTSVTFMLIQTGVAPTLTDDIDADNNGTPDGSAYAGWSVRDSIGALDGLATARGYGAINYSMNGGGTSSGTVITTGFTPGYVGRIGASTGSAATDWTASGTLGGAAPNFTLGAAAQTEPASFAGKPLNHIGSLNFVNLPPVNTVPAAQTINEDTVLTFTGATQISIADPDANSAVVQVTLTAVNGTMSLSGTAGLTFTPPGPNNDGTNDTQMTFTGTIAAINTALNNLTFTPTANFSGAASVTIATNDLGNTGVGGNLTDTDTVNITVNAVNDPPSFTKGADQIVNEDAGAQTVVGWATNISAGPNETGQTLTFNVSIMGTTGNLAFTNNPAINATTGILTYTPAPNTNGTATVVVTLSDNGSNTPPNSNTSAPQTFVITVNAVNDAPSFTKGADQTVVRNAGIQTVNNWATNISAGPSDESGQMLSFTVTNNNNALFSAQPAISPTGTLTYTPATNASGMATVTVTLSDNGGTANGGQNTSAPQTFTITVTVVPGALAFSSPTYTVNENAGTATITVNRTGGTDGSVTVNYATVAGGTATGGAACGGAVDYINASGVLTFGDGAASQTFTVTICNDALNKDAETINLSLTNPTGGATLGAQNTAVLTIANDDPLPTLSIENVSRVEGNSGTSTATFNIVLSAPSGQTVTVNYQTANGTATAGSDYVAVGSTTVTFNPGETTKPLTVTINGDTNKEANETFFVNLSGATNASISDNQAVGIIVDDDRAYVGDFDLDRKTDFSVFRPGNGFWYTFRSSNNTASLQQFGTNGDVPVPGDYNGDGQTDFAVFRPSNGTWYTSLDPATNYGARQWGNATDKPVQGDYDGDGKTDIAVFRNGTWFVIPSQTNVPFAVNFGTTGDVPVQGDYNGDGRTDYAVYRNGVWSIRLSSDNSLITFSWGAASDIPIVGDFDGDGRTDFTVYRSGMWHIFGTLDNAPRFVQFGEATDIPTAGDYDGDGTSDIGVFRPSSGTWFIVNSSNGSLRGIQWGQNNDVPIPANYQAR